MFNTMWKMPARLWRRPAEASAALAAHRPIASGSLEEMIKAAADVEDDEGQFLFIDCVGTDHALAWPEIKDLRRAPTFPVDL